MAAHEPEVVVANMRDALRRRLAQDMRKGQVAVAIIEVMREAEAAGEEVPDLAVEFGPRGVDLRILET